MANNKTDSPRTLPMVAFCLVMALAISALVFWFSRDNGNGTYALFIGDTRIELPLHDDPSRVQDDIMARLGELWRDMPAGHSEPFYLRRSTGTSVDVKLAEGHSINQGRQVSASFTRTVTTAPMRLVKNRNGLNTVESINSQGECTPLILADWTDWDFIEGYLRRTDYSTERLRLLLYFDAGDDAERTLQTSSPNPVGNVP